LAQISFGINSVPRLLTINIAFGFCITAFLTICVSLVTAERPAA
jgi:hypothetical protein